MRIQIAPLPPRTIGDYTETPFILVLDQLTPDQEVDLTAEWAAGVKAHTGAVVVWISPDAIDVEPQMELPADVLEALAERITKEPS